MANIVQLNHRPASALSSLGQESAFGEAVLPTHLEVAQAEAPNRLVRIVFYLSICAVFFRHVYFPGTGDKLGVIRLLQILLLVAALSQPRVCLGKVPFALMWFGAYYLLRLVWGFWLSPHLLKTWLPDIVSFLTYNLPWLWFAFNVLQYRGMARRGLWALAATSSFCALLQIAGIGTSELGGGEEGRSTLFNENANVVGVIYATALIGMVGLSMMAKLKLSHRLLLLPLIGLAGMGLAKTGSRTAAVTTVLGIMLLMSSTPVFISQARRWLLIGLVGVVLGGVLSQVPTVVNRFEMLHSLPARQVEGRARMIPVLWEIFLRSPVYGSGPDQYQFELTRRAMPYRFRQQQLIASHNLALLLLVETGGIGFLVFAGGVRLALKSAWQGRMNSGGLVPWAMLLPLVISGLTLSNPAAGPAFWFALAYACAGRA